MIDTRSVLYLGLLVTLLGIARPAAVQAQSQKYYPGDKHPGVEPLRQEPLQQEPLQGGYQAPPPTGALQGPTRELGFSGGEIELPAIRLRLPRVRFPAFSMFVTPPQMHTEPGVAPLVQQVQEQISVPAPGREALIQPDAPDVEPLRGPYDVPLQKASFQSPHGRHSQPPDTTVPSDQIARIQADVARFESRMEQKLAHLAATIELLAAESRRGGLVADRQPLIEDRYTSIVRPSSHLSVEPTSSPLDEPSGLRRLPPPAPPQPRRLPQ